MSIVQSALERLKKASSNSSEQQRPSTPHSVAHTAAGPTAQAADVARARFPTPVEWVPQQRTLPLELAQLQRVGLYPPDDFVHRQQEDYRRIRREVISASREKGARGDTALGPLIVVTSALPGDGKSYTATNLALSLASEGVYDVLLIDADTVKSTITNGCGAQDRPGLIELLSQPEASFAKFVAPTTIDRLRLLPAGQRDNASSDLLSAGRIGPLLDMIRHSMAGHFVVIDTPPILLASETTAFTDAAGQVLFVVRAGRTLQDSVKDAVGRIRESVPVGVVLNAWAPLVASDRKVYSAFGDYSNR